MATHDYEKIVTLPALATFKGYADELYATKDELQDIVDVGGQPNVIETVKVNGTALTPDANKAVNVTIAESTSNGKIKVNGADVDIHGLGSAAYTDTTAYDASGAAAAVLGASTDSSTAKTVYGAIALANTKTSNVGTITGITTSSPLSGSGTSGSVALSHANSGVVAGSYGDSTAQEPGFGETFKVPYATVNATGHVTAMSAHDVTIPATEATTSAAGLMSADDKAKLDGIAAGAAVGTITGITTTTPLSGSGTSGSVALSHATSGVTAGTYGVTATTALTPGWGDTFAVPGVTVNATGHVTAAGSHTVKVPNATASGSAAGLMSSTHYTKLEGIASGATANAATTTTPKMDGTAAVGTETAYAKGDHVHPTDTSRAPLASPTFTGTPAAPTAAAGTNTTQLATTAFVTTAIANAQTGAAMFQGTVAANTTISNASYKKGWYWVVSTAGTYVGQTCEVGDMIYAIKDKASAYATSDFSVVQANVNMSLYVLKADLTWATDADIQALFTAA